MRFHITGKGLGRTLLGVFFLVLVANGLGLLARLVLHRDHLWGLVPLFDFDHERNVPTFFSSFLLLLASSLLLLVALGHRRCGEAWRRWVGLSTLFTFLALDEFVGLHERLSPLVHDAVGSYSFVSFGWLLPYQVALVLLAIIYVPFICRLSRDVRRLFLVSALVFLMGAMGLEILAAHRVALWNNNSPWLYAVLYTVEESFEMLGVILFVLGLMRHLVRNLPALSLEMGDPQNLHEGNAGAVFRRRGAGGARSRETESENH